MEKDFYINLLSFCNNIDKEFNHSDLIKSEFIDNNWKKQIVETYLSNAYANRKNLDLQKYSNHETIFWCTNRSGDGDYKNDSSKYIMNYDAKFKYIDYIELKEARQSSRRANRNANIALLFAVATIIISTFLTFVQIKLPIELNNKQFNQIISTIKNLP